MGNIHRAYSAAFLAHCDCPPKATPEQKRAAAEAAWAREMEEEPCACPATDRE